MYISFILDLFNCHQFTDNIIYVVYKAHCNIIVTARIRTEVRNIAIKMKSSKQPFNDIFYDEQLCSLSSPVFYCLLWIREDSSFYHDFNNVDDRIW